jgi:acetyl esterase/lipase
VGDPPTYNAERDNVYRPIDAEPEQDPKLAQLDLYFTDLGGGKRVVVYVHCGGWTRGDKSEIHENPRLLEFLLRNECLVASVNLRPIQTNEAHKVTYADQANDIAAALKWLSNHVEEFGGRPEGLYSPRILFRRSPLGVGGIG